MNKHIAVSAFDCSAAGQEETKDEGDFDDDDFSEREEDDFEEDFGNFTLNPNPSEFREDGEEETLKIQIKPV